ncbi:hypothetical protein [Thermoanaerobacter pentosaceus]|uniref:Response regulator receiver protein n=1 Tax=Thermoanaerobacter pentosaceus TaxID=694059 RepID=A0ABT9M2J8_9THEO|nr:hypothetical protein [Thermoanaerobacter pentosaceus]MDP9750354.1 hypothetical protein [Thermoanaerobacter pentosaceus]
MVLIHTGFEEFDRVIAERIEDSRIIFYPDFLLQEEGETAVISSKISTKVPFKDFLFALRQQDKRVILILGDKTSPYIGYALALGIYDIIFDPVTPEKVVEKIKNPSRFSDVAHLYLGLQGRVRFSGVPGEKDAEEDLTNKTAGLPLSNDIDKKIAEGILRLLNKPCKNCSLTEMLLDIEEEIVRILT